MGFKAKDQVEELTYDFNPHSKDKGTIPEPTSDQIDTYRHALVAAFQSVGLKPGEQNIELDQMDDLLNKDSEVEKAMVAATADLTGIDSATLDTLPFRIKRAFLGWIMGQFFNPEG